MVNLNIGCGPFPAPKPWVNLDCHADDQIRPDVLVDDPARPLAAWDDGTVDNVYLGHVLEHIPWDGELEPFLLDIRRALKPGGKVCAVGPDVMRVILRWKDDADLEGWALVESTLEGPWGRDLADGYGLTEALPSWPYARHAWNCYEKRLVFAFEHWGRFDQVKALPITAGALAGWPVVAFTPWQCAVSAVKP